MGRGSNNLNYDDGFKYERENYKIFEPVLKNILGANQLEETSRTLTLQLVLMHTQIQGNVYGISLRVREYNYNSFTLIDIVPTYIVKYTWKRNRNSTIKPAYHVQFNKISDDKVLVIRVNIDAFGMF
jgi:hypothetical protein